MRFVVTKFMCCLGILIFVAACQRRSRVSDEETKNPPEASSDAKVEPKEEIPAELPTNETYDRCVEYLATLLKKHCLPCHGAAATDRGKSSYIFSAQEVVSNPGQRLTIRDRIWLALNGTPSKMPPLGTAYVFDVQGYSNFRTALACLNGGQQ